MKLSRRLRVKPGAKVDLADIDPAGTHGFEKVGTSRRRSQKTLRGSTSSNT
jgi:hypothetical protein